MKILSSPLLASLRRKSATETDEPRFEPSNAPAEAIDRLEHFLFHSAILPDDRAVCVYLPPQYGSEPDRRFPVLYLHDGQNLFDPHTAFIPGRTWRAGDTADRMNQEGKAEPMILVGVSNTGLRRMPEYTPTRDLQMGGGEGEQYGRLLIEELKTLHRQQLPNPARGREHRPRRLLAGRSDYALPRLRAP